MDQELEQKKERVTQFQFLPTQEKRHHPPHQVQPLIKCNPSHKVNRNQWKCVLPTVIKISGKTSDGINKTSTTIHTRKIRCTLHKGIQGLKTIKICFSRGELLNPGLAFRRLCRCLLCGHVDKLVEPDLVCDVCDIQKRDSRQFVDCAKERPIGVA